MKKLIAAAFCIASLTSLAPAQTTPSDQTPTFKVGGEEVVLDVVVRDKKGKVVSDLKPTDFAVSDNGEKRSIKSFRLVQGNEAITSTGTHSQLDPLRQIRLITLIFQAGSQDARRLSRDAGLSLLKTDLGQNFFMSVFTIDHKLEAIQTFTNDRELLKKAIERATGGSTEFASDNLRVRAQLEQILGPMQGGGTSLQDRVDSMSNGSAPGATGAAAAPNGGAAANAAMAQMMMHIVDSTKEDSASDYGRSTIFSLLNAVKEQYRLPGRKSVLYFSEGFSIPQGMEEPFKNVISIANRANVSFYPVDARGLSTYSPNRSAVDMGSGAAAASKANANSATGVNTDMARSVDKSIESGRANTQDTLANLAKSTGGDLIANTNDFKGRLKRLTDDMQTYYEISYDPEITSYNGAFRAVSVRTEDATLRVQSRSGYFALPPSMTSGGKVITAYELPLLKALDEKPLPHSFAFQSTGMHFLGDSGAPTCDVVVDIPLGNMTLQEDKATATFTGKLAYVALVKGQDGQIVKKFNQEVPLKVPAANVETFKGSSHFVYAEHFDLAPGRYTLETAVLDGAGEKISARKSSFMVPPPGTTLAMSSVAVIRNMKQKDANAPANDPLVMQDKVVSPTVSPVIKKSEMEGLPFYMVIYPNKGATDKPTLKMVFSRDGQVLGSGMAPLSDADSKGRIQYVATAPIAKLEPGSYQIQFVAKQGSETAAETVSFTLEP